MKIPSVARYNYCCHKANEFLINENITKLPFDSDKIIEKYKWGKLKYSDLAKTHNTTIENIIDAYDSEDGYSIYTGKNYAIAYNDTIATKQRIYFTKLHEIGHIYLGHFKDFEATILNRSNMTESEYKVLENEANCFARNVLVPVISISEFKSKNPSYISTIFDITLPASKARLDFLKNDLYYFSKKDLKSQEKLLHNFIHKKQCLKCGHNFVSENAKYCSICGHNRLVRGDGTMKYKEGIGLYENNHAIICPRCTNEDIDEYDMFCPICGAYLVQECSDKVEYDINGNEYLIEKSCGNNLMKSNARFCFICGNETTFFKYEYLKDWKEEKEEIEKALEEAASTIEPVPDEDIPF